MTTGEQSRHRTLIRALSVWRTLQAGRRWTLYDLADRFGVHARTIRRDLYALQASGCAIQHTEVVGKFERGEWWIDRKDKS